ncbi:protein IQ-DOMAIN 31 isoform X1 [Sesamum indicum]|uniref:Protein IQ-DOMAIN 31 isoform X1 n=1 Tax=Sesamum indicum TaxID=4182 RepID=A0A6I9TY26_SESIN|nr:protein IQ-DOMAIN 31 isoform X1 [Sesamum indicum]
MGKSPGKWIKGILFGKKTSKSNLSKGRELSKSASEKPARVSSKESISTLTVDAPLISNSVPGTIIDRIENSSFDEGVAAKLASDELVSSSTKQDGDIPLDPGLPNDSEQIRLEEAATVVQASFRGYQARRAFRTLKCIIRLQAVIRGRLVRRQAVATLFCVQGIVKFQAIARGYMVRRSNIGNGQCRRQNLVLQDAKHCPTGNSLKNAFIYGLFQLLSSSPTAKPLCLQYRPGEPNSAWDWLLRWSISQVWAPYPKQKETCESELQIVETEQNKPKGNNRKVRSATVGTDLNHAHTDTEKLKQKGRKLSSQSVKSGQEHQQSANNKVKHGLKKIQKPTGEISNEAEIDDKKPKRFQVKLSKSPAPKFSEQTSNTPTEKPVENLAEASEENDVKSSLELPGANSPVNLDSEELPKPISDKSQDTCQGDTDFKDECVSSENYKSGRRTSLSSKNDDQDVAPENGLKVPSYMATTASSKAKVKLQGSPRFAQDIVDKNGLARRHSLPSSTSGKLSSSPRVRLVQANGREGNKIDRALSSSRDVTDKVIQVDWKR